MTAAGHAAADDLDTLLRLARERLSRRVNVAPELEVAVLVEEVGAPPGSVAAILDIPRETVNAIIARDHLQPAPPAGPKDMAPDRAPAPGPPPREAADGGTASAPGQASDQPGGSDAPPEPDVPRDRRWWWRAALAAVIALVVAGGVALVVTGDGQSPAGACEPTSGRPVCVSEARLTAVVDGSGSPGAARTQFEVGEPVKLWFAFETLDERRAYTLEYVWRREGEPLYTSSFQLPPIGRVNLTLARQFATEPGAYAVEVRDGDTVLVDETFTIR